MFSWECDAFSFAAAHEDPSMSKHHQTETLTFEGFSGYYGSLPQGYGGFVWSDVDYLNDSYWQNVKTDWCDTGYQNVIDGNSLAYAWGKEGKPSYGYFRTDNIKETFSLVSMVAASAWETKQPFTFTGYVYETDKGFVKKGSVTYYLSQTAQKLDFAHPRVPKGTLHPLSNISAVIIKSASGSYGNTCSYGKGHPTYGNQLAFDDLKVKWNGKVPHGAGQLPGRPLLASQHHNGTPAAHVVNLHPAQTHAAEDASAASHHTTSGYQAELLSLPNQDPSGLTTQFHLPNVEHFGS
jgi:hypothetical protein